MFRVVIFNSKLDLVHMFTTSAVRYRSSPHDKLLDFGITMMILSVYTFIVLTDPFLVTVDDDGGSAGGNFIHIRIQQRNGRKTLTTVQGIHSDYDLKKIVKACKKVLFLSICHV